MAATAAPPRHARPEPALPPGPEHGVLAQTVALHRDPLGTLREAVDRYGPIFTLRLATARPIVVVTEPSEVARLVTADPGHAEAGSARRSILPMASPRSVFAGDGERHHAARRAVASLFAPEALNRHRDTLAAIAAHHVEDWPRSRPFRLLPRMRALIDDAFSRTLLGVADNRRRGALVAAIGRMLWTPGNPPLSVPGEGDGVVGAAGETLFEHRRAPVAGLLREEIAARRARGDAADVLGAMAQAQPSAASEALADEAIPLLMAGQEPPAAALTWLLDRLARSPSLAERFAAGYIDDAVVRETLRLHPAAIASLRRLVEPTEIAGCPLPAGVITMVPIPVLQRDPRAYPDPDSFDPVRDPGSPQHYLPFGGGARRCLGEALFGEYVRTIVPTVLRRIRLRPLWPREERMVLRATILVPHRGTPVRARNR